MTFFINIDGVDGESKFHICTEDAGAALKFLDNYDHEGSSVSLSVEVEDEGVYAALKALTRRGE